MWSSRHANRRATAPLEGMIRYGASPRATIALTLAARARAFMRGRGYVTPQDVKSVGPDVLRHRIIVSYEAEAEEMTSEMIIEQNLRRICRCRRSGCCAGLRAMGAVRR